jgi:HSP20 family protein
MEAKMTMTLYRPLRLAGAMDRLFDEAFTRSWPAEDYDHTLPLDVLATDDEYVVTASVPGLKPEELQIEVLGTQATVRGALTAPESNGGTQWLLQERRHGQFSRTLDFPVELDGAHAEASVENGVLTLRIPKAEAAKPKQIRVKAS